MINNWFVCQVNHINELKQSKLISYRARQAAGRASQQLSLTILMGRGCHHLVVLQHSMLGYRANIST